jgi:hypothetical protein
MPTVNLDYIRSSIRLSLQGGVNRIMDTSTQQSSVLVLFPTCLHAQMPPPTPPFTTQTPWLKHVKNMTITCYSMVHNVSLH